MRPWTIVLQTETVDFTSFLVSCKQIRTFAIEDKITGEIQFIPLPEDLLLLQVIVQSDGEQHRIKISAKGRNIKYVWQHPDRMERPTIKIGLGKSGNRHSDTRREIVDTLSPPRRVPGYKAEFATKTEFIAHLNRVLGNELASQILQLFADRLPHDLL